jgi:hypothetical protein
MEFKLLDRTAPISDENGAKTIENIREKVVSQNQHFRISTFEGKQRAGIYLHGVKAAVVEVDDERLSEKEVLNNLKEEVLKGTFDEQLLEVTNFFEKVKLELTEGWE